MTEELKNKVDEWFARNWNHYVSEVRKNIAKGIMADYCDDLCAFMYEEFLKQKPEKVEQMLNDGKVLNWMLRGTSFQLKSGSSPFYTKYRKKRAGMVPTYFGESGYNQHDAVELDDYYLCTMECLEGKNDVLDFYEKKLVEMKFIRQMTFQQIIDSYGFTHTSTKRHITEALKKIETYCNNKLEE